MERLTLAGVPRGAVKLAAVGRDGLRAYANLDLREAQESISLKLSPHGSVSGRVVDAAGRPVPGVTVAVSSGMPKSNQPLQDRYTFVSVSTDDQGTFDAEGLPPGLYSIEVCHHLARLQWAKPPDSNDGSAPHFFRIEAHEAVRAIKLSVVPCDGAIAGTVRDMADRPVAGATVVARPEHRSEGPPFSTDVDRHFAVADHAGRFRLQALCPGSCELVAGDPEAALSARLAEVPTDSQVELKLAARGELSGDIRMGGMPVTDFTLELAGLSARRARLTSSTGSFRLTQLQHGEYELAVVADAGYLRRPIVVDARQRALSDLELTPWALVRGRVVDHRGRGVPQVVVTVSLSSEGYDPNAASPLAFSHQTRTASTCDDGTFTVDRLVRGIGQLAVWSPTSTLRLCPAVYQTPYGWWTGKAAYTRIRVESGAELDLGEVRTCRAEAAASADGLQ